MIHVDDLDAFTAEVPGLTDRHGFGITGLTLGIFLGIVANLLGILSNLRKDTPCERQSCCCRS